MEAKVQRRIQSPGSEIHGVHVCKKCGWQFPNPHPSPKHRRAHKKICGTIKGYELVDPGNATAPSLDDERRSDNEHSTPMESGPNLMDKAEVEIGGIGAISSKSEQEVFEDAACEFSGSPTGLRSVSSMENKEQATMDVEKITKNPCEIPQSSSSSTSCEMRNSGVSDSCEVPSSEILETREPVLISTETVAYKERDDESPSEIMIGSSQVAQVTGASDAVKDVGSEKEDKGNSCGFADEDTGDGMPSELASAVGKRADASDPMWNDDVIYSEVEGPDEFALEKSVTIESGEDESIGSDNIPVDTSSVIANAAQEIAPSNSTESSQHSHRITTDRDDKVLFFVPDDIPFVENAEVALHGFKGHKEVKLNQSNSPSLHETTEKEGYEAGTDNLAEHRGIRSGRLSIDKEVPCSDILLLEHKDEQQGQDDLVVAKEFPIKASVVVSMIENGDVNQPEEPVVSEDIEIKTENNEANESPSGTAQMTGVSETLRMPESGANNLVGESTTDDVTHVASPIYPVDSLGHENESIQENNEAMCNNIKPINEGICMESNPESCGVTEPHVSPMPDVIDGDDVNDHRTGLRETFKSFLPQDDAGVYLRNSEGPTVSSGGAAEENIPVEIANAHEEAVTRLGSTVMASGAVKTSDQKLPKSERADFDFDRVLGGLGVIQGNERNGDDNTQEHFSEVPVVIESKKHRDFGRLQNLSEAHVKSLAPSLLATTNTCNASEAANADKSQPAKSDEIACSVKSMNNHSAGHGVLHSSNVCDSLEVTWGSVSDTPLSVNTEIKKSNTNLSTGTPTIDDPEKSYEFMDRSTGVDSEINKAENPSQSSSSSSSDASAALSKNQEIMEKIPTWCTEKQQHVPLKNLLSEARSPQPEATDNSSAVIPRVSSILGPETSPDPCFPPRGEVSEEWKTPARYPVDVKRVEKKAKNRPFWVPFVCCSSAT